MIDGVTRAVAVSEIGELFQRLADGGSINVNELNAMREHIAMSLSDPNAPTTAYYCKAKLRDNSRCGAEICTSNAPYGRTALRCPVCHKPQVIYLGGYQRYADSPEKANGQGM